MNEDWRIQGILRDDGGAARLHAAAAGELYEQARSALHERAVVTRDRNRIFAYTRSRASARSAQEALEQLAQQERLDASFRIERWHPLREDWEDALRAPDDVTVDALEPHGAENLTEEQLELERKQAQAESKVPEWEIRVQFPSHAEAIEFADKLTSEGIATQRHWHFLLIGAWDADDAQLIADRIRAEAPPGTIVKLEPTLADALSHALRLIPF